VADYSIFIRADLLQQFWQVMAEGGFITDAVAVISTSRRTGRRVLVDAGGVRHDKRTARLQLFDYCV